MSEAPINLRLTIHKMNQSPKLSPLCTVVLLCSRCAGINTETIDAILKAFTMGFHNAQVCDVIAHKFLVCNVAPYYMFTYDTYIKLILLMFSRH